MERKRLYGLIGLSVVFTLVAAACSSSTPATQTPSGGATSGPTPIHTGGVYRTAIEDFGFTGAFDPTGEYLGFAFGLYSQLLIRNLVGYDHVGGVAGDKIVPDLATDTGQVSSDGLTWTFKLKPGLKWGPPLNRAITSKDVLFAFRRIDTTALVAQYGFYFDNTVKGMTGPQAKMPDSISGISTPDDSTVIFTLLQPTGDFQYRLAMPATAPLPEEVAGCFTKAGDYGRNIVSSGPYMILGADQVDASSCSTIKPETGFDPTKFIKFVRNPNYDASTDSPDARSNYLDGVDIEINSNTDDIFNQIDAGTLDGSLASTPPTTVIQKYETDPTLKERLHADSGDRTRYITMNVLTPPFDDLHVRRAVNFVMNKAAFLKAAGGSINGDIATHILPPSVLDFGSDSAYDPYPSTNHEGDLAAAMAEMKQSKYDSNGDGLCDSDVCKNVEFINRTSPPYVNMSPTMVSNLASIGISVKLRELDTGTAYTTIQTVSNLVPIAANAGWGKDYADPSTFAVLFDSSGISCSGQINYSELGMTAALAKACGPAVLAAYNKVAASVPNVDADIVNCNKQLAAARTSCWVAFDKKLMEQVVPWVPYQWVNAITLIGSDVQNYTFDQFSGILSLVHIAVTNTNTITG